MYKITCDNDVIYDPRLDELSILSGKLSLELNKTGSLTFEVAPNHPTINKIHRLTSVIRVYDDNTLLFSGRALSNDMDFTGCQTIACEGDMAYLLDSIQRPKDYHNLTPRTYLEDKLAQHNGQVELEKQFQLGEVEIEKMNYDARSDNQYTNTLDTIMDKLISSNGGYLRVRHEDTIRYLDYVKQYGDSTSQVIRFGENLLDLTQFLDASQLITALIPLGATPEDDPEGSKITIASVNDGKDYIYDEDAVARYGWIVGTQEWSDVTAPANLKVKGEEYLKNSIYQLLTLELSAIDLHMVDVHINRIKLGDVVRVLSPPHGIDASMVVQKREYNLLDPESDKIQLGDTQPSLTEQQITTNKLHLAADAMMQTAKRVDVIGNAVAQVETTVSGITEQVQTIETDTATLATDYKAYKTKTNNIIDDLTARIEALEGENNDTTR